MMADYKATAEDFDEWDKEAYSPSQENFDEWDQEDNQSSIPPIRPGQPESQTPEQPQAQEPKTSTKNIFGAEAPDYPGFKGLKESSTALLSNALKGGIGFLSNPVKSIGAEGLGQEFEKDPLGEAAHAAGQLGVGIAESGKDLINLGLSALTPLSEIGGIPKGGHPVKLQIPETTGLQKALGLESNRRGDEFLKKIPDIAALAYGATGLIKSGYKALNKAPPLSKERRFQNAMKEEAIKSKKVQTQTGEELDALKDEQALKYAEAHEGAKIGTLTPTGQKIEALGKEAEAKRLESIANIPEAPVGQAPLKPNTEALINETKEAKTKASESLSAALKAHENIPLKAGAIIQKHITKLHDAASKIYNKVEKAYKGKDIPVDNTAEINSTAEKLDALIQEDLASGESLSPGYGSGTSEQKALEAKINSLKNQTVKASDVYDMQRTLQNRAQKARDASFGKGLDKTERTRLQKLARRHEKLSQKLGTVLENVGDPDTKALLKEANTGWKAYSDISRTKVGKGLKRGEGQIPSDTLGKIEGTGPGNALLKDLVKKDPELARYLFGQKYGKASKQAQIFEKSDITDEYLKLVPQPVRDKVAELSIALKNSASRRTPSGETVSEIKSKYKELSDAFKKNFEEQASRKKAIEDIDRLTKQAKLHRETSAKLDAKIKQWKSEGKNTAQLEEDLARRKREYLEQDTKLDKLKANLVKAIGAKIGYEALFKKH